MQNFKMIFSVVTILQGVKFPIFPIDFAWALQQACDEQFLQFSGLGFDTLGPFHCA